MAAYTEDELRERIRTLEDGLLLVEKGVQFADRGVTYNSSHELRDRIAYFKGLLSSLLGGRSKQSVGYAARSGFCR